MKQKTWIKSPWTRSITMTIISFLLTICHDFVKEKPVLTTIGNIFKWIWDALLQLLTVEIKLWWILIGIVLLRIVFFIIKNLKSSENFEPDFIKYKEDSFKRWEWSWDWEWNENKRAWIIKDLKAHCPECSTPLVDHSSHFGLNFKCPRCEYRAEDSACEEPFNIERIILDNIKRKRKNENSL